MSLSNEMQRLHGQREVHRSGVRWTPRCGYAWWSRRWCRALLRMVLDISGTIVAGIKVNQTLPLTEALIVLVTVPLPTRQPE